MASDALVALRAELTAALAVLDPQIRGLHDLAAEGVSISPDLRKEISDQITFRENRRQLIQDCLDALDALEADGYPDLPNEPVAGSLYSELQEEMSDLGAASSVFVVPTASTMQIVLGQPQPKPESKAS